MSTATPSDARPHPELLLTAAPPSLRSWLRSIVEHREVLVVLAQKDFKVRYKRASFGVLWAVALPLLQSAVMVVVFSRVTRAAEGIDYTGYVLGGMVGWAYISACLQPATTSIVDGSALTDKVWFPRALLTVAPILANLVGLGIAAAIVTVFQLLRGQLGMGFLLLVPAVVLAVSLLTGAGLVLSALYVRFRDLRFAVQAGMLVAFYGTPVIYDISFLGRLAPLARANPFTGVVNLFQRTFTTVALDGAALAVSVATTVVLLVVGVGLHARNDRLFVDLL